MKQSILTKVLMLFLLVEIPISLISYVSIATMNRQLESKILSSLETEASQFAAKIDSDIKEVYLSNALLCNQANIQQLAIYPQSMSTYQRGEAINVIVDQLSNIVTTNPYLSHANIYFKNTMRVYHTSNSHGSFQDIRQYHWLAITHMAAHPESIHQYVHPAMNSTPFALFVAPATTKAPAFAVEFILSRDYIASLARQESSTYDSLFSIEMCGSVIASNMDAQTQALLPKKTMQHAIDSRVVIDKTQYYYFSYPLPYCNGHYQKLIPADALLSPLKQNQVFLLRFFLVLTICSVIFFISIYRMVHKPLTKLTDAFKALEKGHFNHIIADNAETDFSYLYRAFNKMSVRLSSLIERNYEQKLLMQKAELKQLQAQINPHFLYNSFFLLQSMLRAGMEEESQQMAELLAVYFRYITKNSMDYVPLEEEYKHARVYASIQALRFKERISIQMDPLPETFRQILTPKMILQPILENAFQHGLKNKIKDGIVSVSFHPDGNILKITVEDNSDTLSDETLDTLKEALLQVSANSFRHEMSGLLNIHRRLIIYSQTRGRIEVSRSQLGGLMVTVILDTQLHE